MKTADKAKFLTVITALGATFRTEIDEAIITGYWMALDDLSIEDVERAGRKAMRECEFFPNAKTLRDFVGGPSTADAALIAWAAVDAATSRVGGYKSPDFLDPIVNAVIRNMGGWERFCTATVTEFDTWLRKEFLRVYELIAKRGVGDEEGAPLVGLHERHNRLNGFTDRNTTVEIAVGLPAPAKHPRLPHNREAS